MFSGLLQDWKIFLSLLLSSILLIFFDNLGALNSIKSGAQFITSPIQYGLYKTSLNLGNQFQFIVLTRKTLQEKKALEQQLAQVLSENANLKKKLAETQGFLKQQNILSPQGFNLVAARPIGMGRYLLIDKGNGDGIKLDQAVIYQDNYLGKVKNLSAKKAEIMLISDPDSKVASFVANANGKARGILIGRFGSQEQLLDKILHSENIAKDDLVYSDGTESPIPKGLVLGRVSEVFDRDNEVFKQAKVRSVFNPTDLDVVFVITN